MRLTSTTLRKAATSCSISVPKNVIAAMFDEEARRGAKLAEWRVVQV